MSIAEGGSDPARAADFDDTFRRWWGPMVRSLTVAAGDREVAADCVKDAFLRAYARWRRVSRLDDPPGWIRHVAVNRLRDHFRKSASGSGDVTTTTTAIPNGMQTFTVTGGTVTVDVENGVLSLVSATPNAGFAIDNQESSSDRVEVEFRGNDVQSRVRVRIEDGQLRVETGDN